MTHTPQREPISGPRRLARIAVAVGVVAALSAAGPVPLALASEASPAQADPAVKAAHDKLGSDDADRLAEARADGDKNVTTSELYEFLSPAVEREARKRHVEQTPTIHPAPGRLGKRGRRVWVRLR